MRSAYFITWTRHRRTRELCRELEIDLGEFETNRRGLSRYVVLSIRTVRALLSRRPALVFVQNPSLVLAALAGALRPLLRYRLIVDAHNEAVEPFLHTSAPVVALSRWLLRSADRTIVTNGMLAIVVSEAGGTPIVLPDPLPIAPVARSDSTQKDFVVTVVSTFSGDEPLEEIFSAASVVGDPFRFFVTGDPKKATDRVLGAVGSNVVLTGFLKELDYWRLLASSAAVIDLTSMDNCLVCGAYEAIAVGVPLILSDNRASIETFQGFGEFTANSSPAIVAALHRLRIRHADLLADMPRGRKEYARRWAAQAQSVTSLEF